MTDLTQTIIAKSDQMNADDLIGRSITVKITKVSLLAGDQPVSISYEGDNGKPWKPSKGMRRVLVHVWGNDGNAYVGRSLTLVRDPDVTWAGAKVGGIRISHMSNIKEKVTMALTLSKGNKKPFVVLPLTVPEPQPAHSPEVQFAGDDAASKGVAAYTAWLASLTPDVKATIKHLHADWTKTAKQADSDNETVI